jgi:hypothetical protein
MYRTSSINGGVALGRAFYRACGFGALSDALEAIAEFWYYIYLGLIYMRERSFALSFVLFLLMIHTG